MCDFVKIIFSCECHDYYFKKNSQEFNSCTLNKVFREKLFLAIAHHMFCISNNCYKRRILL